MPKRTQKRSPIGLYGPLHACWLAICIVWTRLFFRPCRLVRLPIAVRGKQNIMFGEGFVCGFMVRLDAFGGPACISFGKNVELNDFVHIGSIGNITIGDEVMIASRVFITDHDHGIYAGDGNHSDPATTPRSRQEVSRAVTIGDRVWIGENVSILPGTQIGNGAIIGANSVVKGIIPASTIAIGIPARVIKRYDDATGQWLKV
jgi:lipopolysaccharide O-acetyltransferase